MYPRVWSTPQRWTGRFWTLISRGRYEANQVAETKDRFGYSLAAGDFNGDGYSDLAIGSP